MRTTETENNKNGLAPKHLDASEQIAPADQKQSPVLPLYDTYDVKAEENPGYRIKVARDFEDMAKVFAIRASACFSDPEHLYGKHFDGNDFSATHLIGYVDGEPVGTIRVRYFAGFTRIERLTIRPTHRKSRMAFRLAKASFAFCRDKGYRHMSGVAREELVPFWSMLGFRITEGKDPIFIYGLPHFDMTLSYDDLPDAISDQSNPLVLLRPEGRWKEAGHHESAKVTAPVAITPDMIPNRARKPRDIAVSMRKAADARSSDTQPVGRERTDIVADEVALAINAQNAVKMTGQQNSH
ncbi:MAG: GNAT family N-acetyltransferase [Beijerinckiaceae bacterium]